MMSKFRSHIKCLPTQNIANTNTRTQTQAQIQSNFIPCKYYTHKGYAKLTTPTHTWEVLRKFVIDPIKGSLAGRQSSKT